MKKLFLLLICPLFFGCDDGDLQIETLDFNSIVTVQTCNTVSITTQNTLFKLNDNQALIIDLAANVLKNEEGVIEIEITDSTDTTLIYRIFSDAATSNYFCDDIPPITPTVIDEIVASKGTLKITTVLSDTTEGSFEHTIEIIDITLDTSQGQRITDLTIDEFGTITTS